jgi:hypothetical protein
MTRHKEYKFVADPLDSEGLRTLIGSLQSLEKFAASSLSSPTSVLLEIGIDLALQLKGNYSPEFKAKLQEFNPVISFDEEHSDELGNPVSYSKRMFEDAYSDADGQEFFTCLANFLVLIRGNRFFITKTRYRRDRQTVKDAFMASFGNASFFPPKEVSSEKTKITEKTIRAENANSKRNYYRRKRQQIAKTKRL